MKSVLNSSLDKSIELNALSNNHGAKKPRLRVGRGIGSGKGKTCGRGVKGQKSRAGVAIKGFEGGQKPMTKRLPKRGFRSRNTKHYQVINLTNLIEQINKRSFDHSKIINPKELKDLGIIKSTAAPVKLLAKNIIELSLKLSLQLDAYSENVKNIVEQAGGKLCNL